MEDLPRANVTAALLSFTACPALFMCPWILGPISFPFVLGSWAISCPVTECYLALPSSVCLPGSRLGLCLVITLFLGEQMMGGGGWECRKLESNGNCWGLCKSRRYKSE